MRGQETVPISHFSLLISHFYKLRRFLSSLSRFRQLFARLSKQPCLFHAFRPLRRFVERKIRLPKIQKTTLLSEQILILSFIHHTNFI